jgi:hypothetical protein
VVVTVATKDEVAGVGAVQNIVTTGAEHEAMTGVMMISKPVMLVMMVRMMRVTVVLVAHTFLVPQPIRGGSVVDGYEARNGPRSGQESWTNVKAPAA